MSFEFRRAVCVVTWAWMAQGVGVADFQAQARMEARTEARTEANSVLIQVADVPLPGPAVRFDYQSMDADSGRLYIAHMNANQLVVFDTKVQKVIANLDGFESVHGVMAVPQLHLIYASTTGDHQVVALDAETLKIIGRAGLIDYPDGLAYAPREHKVFVSDEHGAVDAVIDATTNILIAKIPLGGGAGNTVYDAGSGYILVAVHGQNVLVAIDPATNKIVGRYALPGIEDPHGIALDMAGRMAYVAGEGNSRLAAFDLRTFKVVAVSAVGTDPDVLAYDAGLKRLYVAAESGNVTVFSVAGHNMSLLGKMFTPHAHTVAVDPATHLVYFPLQDIAGHPVLRIMRPGKLDGDVGRGSL
jgi:DNA-binding beta-propeller fold protein YncE